MDENKPTDVVSEFIRFLIAKWELGDGTREGRGLIKDLAEQAGLAKSMPSQIKARTSAASFYSAEKLAKPFGYPDLPTFVAAAYAWWRSDRQSAPAPDAETPLAEALRIIRSYGITESQVQRTMDRYPPDEYAHKDALWWLAKFHEARSDDADRAGDARAEKSLEASTKRRVMRGRDEIRAAAKVARETKTRPRQSAAKTDRKAG